jgi:Chondroitinase B
LRFTAVLSSNRFSERRTPASATVRPRAALLALVTVLASSACVSPAAPPAGERAANGGSGGTTKPAGTGGAQSAQGGAPGTGGSNSTPPAVDPPAGSGGASGQGGSGTTPAPQVDATAPEVDADPGKPGPAPAGADEPPACLRMVDVNSAATLTAALGAAKPGDCIMAADGAYGPLDISAKGTAEAPIQVRAVNLLKASVTGLRFTNAAHVVVRGFAMSTMLFVNSNYCRVTRCQVRGPGNAYWVRVEEQKGCQNGCTNTPPGTSDHSRIDHCDIGGGSSSTDIINPTGLSTNTRIDHNYIHDTSGQHLITVGCCGPKYDYFESGTIIEHNLFVNANGTSAEMISIKGAKVAFRYNTVRRHNGDIDIRAGKNNEIYGNYILGPGPGLRMYEDNHKIYNNYVVGGLVANRSGPIHAPVRNAIIVHNTFTGSVGVAGGNNVLANNILLGGGGSGMGNLGGPAAAVGLVEKDGILTLMPGSKAIGAAVGSYPFVMDDIAGRPRGAKADVGAEQLSDSPILRRPLTIADVGPMAP